MDRDPHGTDSSPARRCSTALRQGCRHVGSNRHPRPIHASIYADGSTCLEGDGITISSGTGGGGKSSVPAGMIELNGAGESDSDGHALTIVDGAVGAGVTGVTITRSDGSSVQAPSRTAGTWPRGRAPSTLWRRGGEPERNAHGILPDRARPPEPGLPGGRPLRGQAAQTARRPAPTLRDSCVLLGSPFGCN
jgi:hypothetical protein